MEAIPALLKKCAASWSLFATLPCPLPGHELKWSQCSPLATQDGDFADLTVPCTARSGNPLNVISCSGRHHGCRLAWDNKHFCFDHCIAPGTKSPNGARLLLTSHGFKRGCAQAILSSSISGVELTTTNVS